MTMKCVGELDGGKFQCENLFSTVTNHVTFTTICSKGPRGRGTSIIPYVTFGNAFISVSAHEGRTRCKWKQYTPARIAKQIIFSILQTDNSVSN
jgi:hypothetical protein